MSKEGHRELFEKFCRTKYFDHTTTSKTVSEEKAKKIIDVLNGIERSDVSNSFKFWVIKTKKFALLNCPELKLESVLCLPAKQRVRNDGFFVPLFTKLYYRMIMTKLSLVIIA